MSNISLATDQNPPGLLLIGHGSREPAGSEEFLALAKLVAARTDVPVAACFLEFAEPSIAAGVAALANRGVQQIVAAPVLLFAAGHIKRDIPQALSVATSDLPQMKYRLVEHLGCHPAIVQLSVARFRQALASDGSATADRTALVMVGRGSTDAGATEEMQRFVALRAQETPVARVATGYLAMAAPSLEDVLSELAANPFDRIVVQPHLLFGGVLVERVAATVQAFAERYPNREWICTGHLGPDELVARAVLDRAGCAMTV